MWAFYVLYAWIKWYDKSERKSQVWKQQMKFFKQDSLKYKHFFSIYGMFQKTKLNKCEYKIMSTNDN